MTGCGVAGNGTGCAGGVGGVGAVVDGNVLIGVFVAEPARDVNALCGLPATAGE
jgi:hypothetical protein